MSASKKRAALRAAVGAEERHHPGSARVEAARRDLKECQLEEAINAALSTAPTLTAEQRLRLSALLTPTSVTS
jgi:hypothetical protein